MVGEYPAQMLQALEDQRVRILRQYLERGEPVPMPRPPLQTVPGRH